MASINKTITFLFGIVVSVFLQLTVTHGMRYEPNWDSLDTRPNPAWYDESKVGIFMHWGVFSVPSLLSEWFWEQWEGRHDPRAMKYMAENYKQDFTYADFAKDFTAELFDPDQWADIFNASGAK